MGNVIVNMRDIATNLISSVLGQNSYYNTLNSLISRFNILRENYLTNEINRTTYYQELKKLENDINYYVSQIDDLFIRYQYHEVLSDVMDEENKLISSNVIEPSSSNIIQPSSSNVIETSISSDEYQLFRDIINNNNLKIVTNDSIKVKNYPRDNDSQKLIFEYIANYLYDLIKLSIDRGANLPVSIVLTLQFFRIKDNTEIDSWFNRLENRHIGIEITSGYGEEQLVSDYNTEIEENQHTIVIGVENLSVDRIDNMISEIIETYMRRYNVTISPIIRGFNINFPAGGVSNEEYLDSLRAFKICANPKFHLQSAASVSKANLCIYETWIMCTQCRSPSDLISWTNKKNREYEVDYYLKEEGSDIEESVRNGYVKTSIQLLVDKYNYPLFRLFIDESPDVYLFRPHKPVEHKLKHEVEVYKSIHDSISGSVYDAICNREYEHMAPYSWKGVCKDENIKKHIKKRLSKPELKHEEINKHNDNRIICAFDFETYNVENKQIKDRIDLKPYMLSYKIGDDKSKAIYDLECVDKFISVIRSLMDNSYFSKSKSKKVLKKYIFYAHSGSKFDFKYLHLELRRKGLISKTIYKEDKSIAYIKCGNVELHDSVLILPGKLRDLAKLYCNDNRKTYFPYKFSKLENLNYIGDIPDKKYWDHGDYDEYIKTTPSKIFDFKQISIDYCCQDVDVLHEIMCKFLNGCKGEMTIGDRHVKFDVRNATTTANMAVKLFKQTLHKDVIVYSPPENVENAAREAYYGGLTGNLKKKLESTDKSNIWYIDRNSSYPDVMRRLIPTNYSGSGVVKSRMDKFVDTNLYLVKINFERCLTKYPNLVPNTPIRHEGKLYQIVDQTDMYRWRWGCELNLAIKHGAEIDVKKYISFHTKELFKDFVETLYALRCELKKKGDKESECEINRLKLMLNSIYGKFGQKIFRTTRLVDKVEYKRLFNSSWKSDWQEYEIDELDDSEYKLVSYADLEDQSKNIGHLIHIASYITAAARTELCNMMMLIGYENIIYFDTDSIVYSSDKIPREDEKIKQYVDDFELGKWKLEYKKPLSFIITLGPKMYCMETGGKVITKLKGIPQHVINNDKEIFNSLLEKGKSHTFDLDKIWRRDFSGVYFKLNTHRVITAQLSKREFISDNESKPLNKIPN